ncbi:hypothetical protein CICLE_v10003455mg [Citrus x clementina]|uniref:RBR-type E3 ubiquitin transferase n=2 Tax=Citrus TaxID=2706 RepID=V4TET8_CITCL|nr:probable E3 ubiquitin-protein ligase ARI2 [Citrus x clementina]XP_006473421.2 probable E3 ubiquitin-protein ligase ARI2 isoform X1 [Citrus sinensis]ESR48151.1 hypothetical protein CICLE_v10003455mg [Citrus x clementina]
MEDYGNSDDEHQYLDDDEVDIDDNGYGFEAPETENMARASASSMVIPKESLLAAQMGDLLRVMDLLSVKEKHARTLLIHYRWDVEKVFAVLVEEGKDKLFAQAGVTVVENDHQVPLSQCSSTFCCNICCDDVSPQEVTTMDCGHCFCNNCWTEHFIVKINDGQSRRIKCMALKCNVVCDEAKIRCLVSARDSNIADKFERFLLESYIDDNRRVKWCPSVPHCGNAIQVEADELCEVECACGFQFCFSCSSVAHSPCSCLMWELWSKKFEVESLSLNWISSHTKPCPKCCKPIEKNGGCNMVRCKCGITFNWISGLEYSNGYIEVSEKRPEHGKWRLESYYHCHKLYKAHTESFRLEYEMKEDIQDKIKILGEKDTSSKDFGWIKDGLNKLFRARRILSFSYPFAFYMFADDLLKNEMTREERKIKQNFFEDQQQQFETNIERLSLILEENFEKYSEHQLKDFRMRVITQSVTADYLCRNLYEWIEADLLGSLKHSVHKIAPFNSAAVEKASKIPYC